MLSAEFQAINFWSNLKWDALALSCRQFGESFTSLSFLLIRYFFSSLETPVKLSSVGGPTFQHGEKGIMLPSKLESTGKIYYVAHLKHLDEHFSHNEHSRNVRYL